MSTTTGNLGLFKYDTSTDGKEVFSINTALNYNWDIIDSSLVQKSGDTMTGVLVIKKDSSPITLQRTDWDFANPVSGHANNYIHFWDKNGQSLSCIQERFGTDYHDIFLRLRPLNDSTTGESSLPNLGLRNVGGKTYGVSPESDAVGSICTTAAISKTASGYVKFGNGIIIQWGHYTATTTAYETGVSVNLSVSYSNKNYILAFGINNPNVGRGVDFNDFGWISKTVSSFKLLTESTTYTNGCDWIAIGY